MPWMTWLAAALRNGGLPVREIPGWQQRGHGAMADVRGVLCHHTAGPTTGNYPSERVVVNGRTGLAGPLANLGLARDGTWIVIAAGQAWHAGTGAVSWCPTNSGNSHLIGVEAESVGTRDDWTPAQRHSYPRGVAALLRHLQLPASRAIGHKEWAPTRKIDPAFWDMNAFRADVHRWLTNQEDPFMALSDAEQRELLDRVRGIDGLRMNLPEGARHPGNLANAVLSIWSQMFFDTDYGPALAARPEGPVDTDAVVAGVVDAITARGIAAEVADELARRLAS